MAVKEKSFSLTRLFHKSTTKLGGHRKSSSGVTTATSCEIHKNVKASNGPTGMTTTTATDDLVFDQNITLEQNNNHDSDTVINTHKKITKTKSDTELATRTNVNNNHECSSTQGHGGGGGGHRLSLKRLKFNHKKNSSSSTLKSTSSSQSSSFKEDYPSKRQSCLSISDFEIEDDGDDERDPTTVHPYAVLFESIQYKDTSLLDNVFRSYPNLDINCFNEDGIAAIHFAAMVGSTPCIESMVDYGADIDLQDIRGNPPIHYAISMKKYEFAGVLIKLGAKTDHLSSQLYPELKKKSRKTWHFF